MVCLFLSVDMDMAMDGDITNALSDDQPVTHILLKYTRSVYYLVDISYF